MRQIIFIFSVEIKNIKHKRNDFKILLKLHENTLKHTIFLLKLILISSKRKTKKNLKRHIYASSLTNFWKNNAKQFL